ncbi:unnamed protein product [Phaeothamnion confervicola]
MATESQFREPVRAIHTVADLKMFHESATYADVLNFIRACSDAVRGKEATGTDYPVSHAISHIVGMMETMAGWVDEIPALQQPMRFGNKAFR